MGAARAVDPLSTLLLFGAGLIYGLTFTCNKIAVSAGIPPVAYVFWQCLGAGLVLLAVSLAAVTRPGLSGRDIRRYFVISVPALALPFTVLSFVAPKLPAGVLAMGQVLVPMLTYLFAIAARLDRPHFLKVGGILVGLAGVLLILVPGASLPAPDMVWWLLLGFSAPLLYAFSSIAAVLFRPPETPSAPMAAALLLASALFLLPLMAATGSWWFFAGAMDDGDWALLGVTAINALYWVLFFEIIRRAGPVFFSTFNYIVTLSGVLWGVVIFGDRPSAWIWGALVLMLAGLFLVIAGPRLDRRTGYSKNE